MKNRDPKAKRLPDGERPLAAGVTLLLIALAALSILCLQPGPALPMDADPSRRSAVVAP